MEQCPFRANSTDQRMVIEPQAGGKVVNDHGKIVNDEPKEKLKELHKEDVYRDILDIPIDTLIDEMSCRPPSEELVLAFRQLNKLGRANYAQHISRVGRHVYPVIIATDHDPEHSAGVGTTFTLYLDKSTEMKITPALNTYYEVYKSACHAFLGLAVIFGPHLKNPETNGWVEQLEEYQEAIDKALRSAQILPEDSVFEKQDVVQMMTTVLEYIAELLDSKRFEFDAWLKFNENNFPLIHKLMQHAAKGQADADVAAMLKWKKMLGPKLWNKLYVVIPTVWPVGGHNPRQELFRNLLDEERVNTHIALSEFPRDTNDCLNLLGRVVGDRSIGRFVFGDQTFDQRMKLVGISTTVDLMLNDFVPALYQALERHGVKPRSLKPRE